MLDRDKVINWHTGRISDAELAEWTGMAPRAVGLVLNLPYLRGGVSGGGRGSRHIRRIHPQVRNAVPIIHALSEGGLTFEAAANVIAATPVIASGPTDVVDWKRPFDGVRSMMLVDPRGNWLPSDIVSAHLWERFVFPCYRADLRSPGPGDIIEVEHYEFTPDNRDIMVVDLSEYGRPNLELKSLTRLPVYSGEIDPLGLYAYENYRAEALPRFDEHLLIVNGRWVFLKSPEPTPLEAMSQFRPGDTKTGEPAGYDLDPVSVIEADKKTVRVIGWGADEEEQERAHYHLANADTLLDVNLTLAVRKMKRRAYGLPVGTSSPLLPFEERVKIAQRYPAPEIVKLSEEDKAALIRKEEDFLRVWSTDAEGNQVRAGLTKEESEELETLERWQTEYDLNNNAHPWPWPWSSAKEMRHQQGRLSELHEKHEAARLKRIAEELRNGR